MTVKALDTYSTESNLIQYNPILLNINSVIIKTIITLIALFLL